METKEMGRVLVEATVENLEDLWAKSKGFARQRTFADSSFRTL